MRPHPALFVLNPPASPLMIDVILVRLMIVMAVGPLLAAGVGAQPQAGTHSAAQRSGAGTLSRDVLNDATMSAGEREAILSGQAAPSPHHTGIDRQPALQVRAQPAPPPGRVGMDRDSARRTLQQRHVLYLFPGNRNYDTLRALPIMGDEGQVRVALAALELTLSSTLGNEADLMRRHLSRLVAEKLLGRRATRARDVTAALEYERAESASFARLQAEVFRKLIETSLLTRDVVPDVNRLPVVKVEVRQATSNDLEVTGRLRFRIPQAPGAGAPFERGCTVRPTSNPEWSTATSGGRTAAVDCGTYSENEHPADFAHALERLRAGQASAEIAPAEVIVLPVSLEASLPYEQAVELISGGGCRATATCHEVFLAWLTAAGPQAVVMGFLAAQLAVALLLLWLSRRAPLSPASRRLKWSLAYLALVVLMHVAMVATSLRTGSLLVLMGWYVLGLPLLLPGFFLGLAAVAWGFTNAALRRVKIVLGVLAVTTPVLEWLLMSGVQHSGYGGY